MNEGIILKRRIKNSLALFILLIYTLLCFGPDVSAQNYKSRPLRIYWEEREHINPLATFDSSGSAIMQLCYDGLFEIDDIGNLKYSIAESAEWSADHKSLTIKIRDLRFTNGNKLSTDDVIASILARRDYLNEFLKGELEVLSEETANEENQTEDEVLETEAISEGTDVSEEVEEIVEELSSFSIYEQIDYFSRLQTDPFGLVSLMHIESIEALSANEIQIRLYDWAERLPWVLTFPIIPKSFVNNFKDEVAPGTGRYRMSALKEDLSLQLLGHRIDRAEPIEVKTYTNEEKALQAYEEGKIDCLYLQDKNFSNLSQRQDIISIPQEGTRMFVALFGNASGYPFSDQVLRNAFKHWHRTWPNNSILLPEANLPYQSRDWRSKIELQVPLWNSDKPAFEFLREALKGKDIVILAPATARGRKQLDFLAKQFSLLELGVEQILVPEAQYPTYVAMGEYDICFVEIELTYPFDPLTLRSSLENWRSGSGFALPDFINANILAPMYSYSINASDKYLLDESLLLTEQAYFDSIWNSDFILGTFLKNGLILSKEVEGQISPPAWDPYRGIEALRCYQ